MDPIKLEKFQAMKRYNKSRSALFLQKLINHTLTVVAVGLFLSCPLWLPKLCLSVDYFVFVVIPTVRNAIFSPKCLFFVCNVIVVFLLNESKRLESGGHLHLKPDVYDEYVEERKRLTKMLTTAGSEPKWVKQEEEEEEEEEEMMMEIEYGEDQNRDEAGEVEDGLSADDLKKKFEDFIAMINEQRRIEARMLMSKNS